MWGANGRGQMTIWISLCCKWQIQITVKLAGAHWPREGPPVPSPKLEPSQPGSASLSTPEPGPATHPLPPPTSFGSHPRGVPGEEELIGKWIDGRRSAKEGKAGLSSGWWISRLEREVLGFVGSLSALQITHYKSYLILFEKKWSDSAAM